MRVNFTSHIANFTFCNTVYRWTSEYCSLISDERHPDRTPRRCKSRFDSDMQINNQLASEVAVIRIESN